MDDAKHGRTNNCCQLLAHGADVNEQDENGMTPMMYAAINGAHESVGLLLKPRYHANVNARDISGWTALMYAASKWLLPWLGRRAIVSDNLFKIADKICIA